MQQIFIPYRPDIDGLRAIAVFAVIFYHIFPTTLSGGFIGVDIFFVISGYLISSIIFVGIESNRFCFWNFYIRRIKRIFPALLTILVFVSIVGWFILMPLEYIALGKHIRSTALFFTNQQLLKEIGYFNTEAEFKPLLHIWSLSLEEQFYIVFPILAMAMYQYRRFTFIFLLVAIFTSFALNIHYLSINQEAAFYLMWNRAWELLLGSILSYGLVISETLKNKFYILLPNPQYLFELLSITGFVLIVYAGITFHKTDLFPGFLALFPTIGAVLLIISEKAWFNQKILASKVLVWFGLMSYALYLWHWPLIAFSRIFFEKEVGFLLRVFILFVSIILAFLTTFLLEKPIRRSSEKMAIFLLSLMIIVLGFSFVIVKSSLPTRVSYVNPFVHKIDKAKQDWSFPTTNLKKLLVGNVRFYQYGEGQKKIVFVGDSNMEQYWPRIEKLVQANPSISHDYSIIFATRGRQFPQIPIPPHQLELGLPVEEINYLKSTAKLILDPQVVTVVFAAQWTGYFVDFPKDNEKRYHDLEHLLTALVQQGKKVYLVLNIPTMKIQEPLEMIKNRHVLIPWQVNKMKNYPIALWKNYEGETSQRLAKIASKAGARVISPIPYLCPHGKCRILDKNENPIYRDISHLRAKYVRNYAKFIDSILEKSA